MTWGDRWVVSREQQRIQREILRRIQRNRPGKTTATIAEELRDEFAAAGMPQPPEQVHGFAEAIAEHRWPATYFLGQLIDLAAHRRIPPGLRLEEHRLPGEQWVPVRPADTPAAPIILRDYRRLQGFTEQLNPSAPLRARLISVPGAIAVLLGSTFAGTIPPEHTAALSPVVDEAERAHRKLTVDARIDDPASLVVSIPRPGGSDPEV